MDRTALARRLREALFDHIETGRRDALQDSAIDSLFEKVLASWEPLATKAPKRDTIMVMCHDGVERLFTFDTEL